MCLCTLKALQQQQGNRSSIFGDFIPYTIELIILGGLFSFHLFILHKYGLIIFSSAIACSKVKCTQPPKCWNHLCLHFGRKPQRRAIWMLKPLCAPEGQKSSQSWVRALLLAWGWSIQMNTEWAGTGLWGLDVWQTKACISWLSLSALSRQCFNIYR